VSLHPEVEALFAERRASPPGLTPVFAYKIRTSRCLIISKFYFRRPSFFHTDLSSSPLFISDNQNSFSVSDFTFIVISKLFRLYYRSFLTVSTLYNSIVSSACNSSLPFFAIYWAIACTLYFCFSTLTIF
jgi:hypothetical protein